MTKMNGQTMNIIHANRQALLALFPGILQDGVINVDRLREYIGENVVTGDQYQFTWPGKDQAKQAAYQPSVATLLPMPERSVDWDNTQNIYIEGDNFETLKLLQKSYYRKIKMIYIDPPYNTGHDFIYRDDYRQPLETYMQFSGQADAEGNVLTANTETSGRFHSNWLNMIYPRLQLARNLLSDDGVIFISIDDTEVANLRKVCDEIFGENNFVAQLIWERAYSPKNDAKYISNSHDYVLMYARNIDKFKIGRLPRTAEANARYMNPDNDVRGPWMSDNMSVKTYSKDGDYPIKTPSGRIIEPPAGRCWRLSKKAFFESLQDNRIWFGKDGDGVPRIKRFLSELKFDGMAPTSILFYKDVGHSQEGRQELVQLFDGQGYFDGPKPVRLLKHLLTLANTDPDSIVLDFFSGSATLAHAVLEKNAEDDGRRRYILVQLPEKIAEDAPAYEAGYRLICDIGEERIRRAAQKIREEHTEANIDGGFRVYRLDRSNILAWDPDPDDLKGTLRQYVDNIRPQRSTDDILQEVMLKLGLDLVAPIEKVQVAGKTIYAIGYGLLMVCLDADIPLAVAHKMAAMHREQEAAGAEIGEYWRVVFRDTGFADLNVKINSLEILKDAGLKEDQFYSI